jgi:HSP20 family molecular chaperone IbpA
MVWYYNDSSRFFDKVDKLLDPRYNNSVTTGYDLRENESGMTLAIDLPGAKSSDLKVDAMTGIVKIKGKQKGKDFSYEYYLSKAYDPSTGVAKLEDGVLTMTFNKFEVQKPKVFSIQIT